MFKGVEVALVHCLLFIKINLADKVAIIATHNIRVILGHFCYQQSGEVEPIVEFL